jgi:DNA mismatch endonuclease (patch repair protein)
MDTYTASQRSWIMSRVRATGTTPEQAVAHLLELIYPAYQRHSSELIGRPDFSFPSLKLALFIHGCFWHGHHCRAGQRKPKSNPDYWESKLARNRVRDRETAYRLILNGWHSEVIWECETRDQVRLTARLNRLLRQTSRATG